jgi:hypothetical protein
MSAVPQKGPSDEVIKDTYLSTDGIPPAITIHERSEGVPPTIVQFTSGHHFDDKTMLATKNFTWNKKMKTYVRIWAKDTCLSSLLRTYAIEPDYIMPDDDEFYEFNGHCILSPRCFMISDVFADINSALNREGFKWSREKRVWVKKMKPSDFRKTMGLFKKAPVHVSRHGTDQVESAMGNLKRVRQDQNNVALQSEYSDWKFEKWRNDFMYRLHRSYSDQEYRRASSIYGQQIKQLAAQGIYEYPPPPELPRYR